MSSNLEKALELILEKKYNQNDPLDTLSELVPANYLMVLKKNDTILSQKDPLNYLYFLLSGHVSVWGQIAWNNNNVIEHLEPLEILGLVEYLNDIPYYTAYILAESKCTLLRIPTDEYADIIQNNNRLCFLTLCVLGNVTASNMACAAKQNLLSSKDILGHYLYAQSRQHRPYICPVTRADLADLLHINLRTLYRHIDAMEQLHYLTLRKGKIVVDEEQFQRLESRYGNVIF